MKLYTLFTKMCTTGNVKLEFSRLKMTSFQHNENYTLDTPISDILKGRTFASRFHHHADCFEGLNLRDVEEWTLKDFTAKCRHDYIGEKLYRTLRVLMTQIRSGMFKGVELYSLYDGHLGAQSKVRPMTLSAMTEEKSAFPTVVDLFREIFKDGHSHIDIKSINLMFNSLTSEDLEILVSLIEKWEIGKEGLTINLSYNNIDINSTPTLQRLCDSPFVAHVIIEGNSIINPKNGAALRKFFVTPTVLEKLIWIQKPHVDGKVFPRWKTYLEEEYENKVEEVHKKWHNIE